MKTIESPKYRSIRLSLDKYRVIEQIRVIGAKEGEAPRTLVRLNYYYKPGLLFSSYVCILVEDREDVMKLSVGGPSASSDFPKLTEEAFSEAKIRFSKKLTKANMEDVLLSYAEVIFPGYRVSVEFDKF